MDRAYQDRLAQCVAEAAEQRAGRASPYLDRVRRATARVGSSRTTADDARSALLIVEDYVGIDVDVPTVSRWRALAVVKIGIKRLTRWYFGYVAHRVTLLGYAIVRFGISSVQLTEDLQERTQELREKIEDLQARVDRLEQRDRSDED
jgi:hypothetical protein